jgi:phage terminase large subunit-like protein
MQPESSEVNLFELDWSNISPKFREEILIEHVRCVNLARKVVNAEGAYVANLRSLVIMLTVSMAMAIYGAENRTIALTLVSIQFLKTLASRLFEASLQTATDIAQKEFIAFMKRKSLI